MLSACGQTPAPPVNPLFGQRLWVDPQSPVARAAEALRAAGRTTDADALRPISSQPVATWLTHDDPAPLAKRVVDAAEVEGALAVLVLYHRPHRDCGNYSAGGSPDAAAYARWIATVADAIGSRRVVVILEPNTVPQLLSGDCATAVEEMYAMLAGAVERLAANERTLIYLDAGTTTHSIVPLLSGLKDLTVVTNDFLIVGSLFRDPTIAVIHTGGNVDPSAGCAQGLLAAETVSRLNIDTYFISTAGWSIAKGVSSPSSDKALLKEAVLAASTRSVLVADSTKYGASSMVKVFGLDRLDLVITDSGLPRETADDLRQLGVDLELAPFP